MEEATTAGLGRQGRGGGVVRTPSPTDGGSKVREGGRGMQSLWRKEEGGFRGGKKKGEGAVKEQEGRQAVGKDDKATAA